MIIVISLLKNMPCFSDAMTRAMIFTTMNDTINGLRYMDLQINLLYNRSKVSISNTLLCIEDLRPVHNIMFALRPEVDVNEYLDAGIEPSSISASTSASVFIYIDFWSQHKANIL